MEKVLYVIYMHEYSGAETAQIPMLRADPDAIVACPPDSPVDELMGRIGVATTPLGFRTLRHSGGPIELLRSIPRGLSSALETRRVLRAHADRRVVYCTAIRSALVVAIAQAGLRKRVIWVIPDFLPPVRPLRFAVRALAWFTCTAALPLSQVIADDLVGRSRRLRRRTTVVYPGVDVDATVPQAESAGSPRAAIVGHVSPLKRTDLAVDITALVRAKVPDFELDVLGRAQYRDEDFELERALHARVEADPALRDAVHFLGKVDDVPGTLARTGLLLHCRPDEPFGMVLIEAMAAGLPVVAPDRAGPKEIVVHGETGLLYRPDDARSAADAVLEVLADPERAARMGAAGRRRVAERFTDAQNVAALQAAVTRAASA